MPPEERRLRALRVIDTQAGGDVSRIVLGGVAPLPGDTVLEQARFLEREADGLRRLLLYEPYGDPAMSVDLVVPATDPRAEAGYVVMEAMGYPVYSGSNTICTATALLESGTLPMHDGRRHLVLEAPLGVVQVTADCKDRHVASVTCEGGPAYVVERDAGIELADRRVRFDLVWSGGLYALVDAREVGLELTSTETAHLAAFAHALVETARPTLSHVHPEIGEVGPLSFVHFCGPVEREGRHNRSRSATYVHPGVLCRSPTGTGTSARLALMAARGEVDPGDELETISLRGSRFTGAALDTVRVGNRDALRSTITGRAWTLARSEIVVDLDDPLVEDRGLSRILRPPHSAPPLAPL